MDLSLATATGAALIRLGTTPTLGEPSSDAPVPSLGPPRSPSDSGADGAESIVIEHLRVRVPAAWRQIWLEAERACWEPWLQQQPGFLGRDLFWDPQRQEGVLLIRWASRDQWHAIPSSEVAQVQELFERQASQLLREVFQHWGEQDAAEPPWPGAGTPFPLVFSGEAEPDQRNVRST